MTDGEKRRRSKGGGKRKKWRNMGERENRVIWSESGLKVGMNEKLKKKWMERRRVGCTMRERGRERMQHAGEGEGEREDAACGKGGERG